MDVSQNTDKREIQEKQKADKYFRMKHLTNNRYKDKSTTGMQDRSTELCKLHTGLIQADNCKFMLRMHALFS